MAAYHFRVSNSQPQSSNYGAQLVNGANSAFANVQPDANKLQTIIIPVN